MTIDARVSRALVLGCWSAFFCLLQFTGKTDHYLGTRTAWVVPFGAVVTGVAAVMLLAQGASGAPLGRGEAFGMLALLAPIMVAFAVPNASLGAAAAERRAPSYQEVVRLARSQAPQLVGLSYAAVMSAQDRAHPQPGVKAGAGIRLIGFVMRRDGTPSDLFQVARFQINCCVADAQVLYVTVKPPALMPKRDQWVDVTGKLAWHDNELIVNASSVQPIQAPKDPYLSASQAGKGVVPVGNGTKPPDPYAQPIRTARVVPIPPKLVGLPAVLRAVARGPQAITSLQTNRISRNGVVITITKVEFATTETRAIVTVSNRTKLNLSIFGPRAGLDQAAIAVSGNARYGAVFSSYPDLPYGLLAPGNSTSAAIVFPPINPKQPLKILLKGTSETTQHHQPRKLAFTFAWSRSGRPENPGKPG